MQGNPENEALINRLLTSHQMEISTISHEIRNPLTLVYSTLQLIESQHPEVLTFSHWTELHQDIEYMKFLLEDLSSYNNGERLELTPVSASTYFRRIALSFAASIVDTDIEFISRIPEDLPEISADPVKLRQAVLNLLRNACDALNKKLLIPRSRSLHSLSLSRQILCISGVKGQRMRHRSRRPEDYLRAICHSQPDGTGLGLAITRRIIQAHHGTVTLNSVLHNGTTFTLTLPVQ